MLRKPRTMRLTDRHVGYLQPTEISEDMPDPPEGMYRASEDDHRATIAQLMAEIDDPGEIWFFAYGSLMTIIAPPLPNSWQRSMTPAKSGSSPMAR